MATSFVQKFIRSLIKSLGLKRKLSAAFQTIAVVIGQIPGLAPFASALSAIAGYLGIAGFAHAAASAEKKQEALTAPLATIAAFFNALVLAAQTSPQLKQYEGLFVILASIFSVFSSGTSLVSAAQK